MVKWFRLGVHGNAWMSFTTKNGVWATVDRTNVNAQWSWRVYKQTDGRPVATGRSRSLERAKAMAVAALALS